jgi:hypothetical protein
VQQFCLDAEDAENEGEGGAAEIEEQLAGIDDAAGEVVEVVEDLGVVDGGFHGLEHAGLQRLDVGEVADADDQSEEDGEGEDAGDGLVAR